VTRYKWYRVGLPGTQAQFLKNLGRSPLAADGAWGFVHLPGETERPAFRFLWRANIVAFAFDDAGNQTRQVFTTVEHCDFVVLSKGQKVWLRVTDPPRSLRDFLNALEMTAGMNFFAEPVLFSQKKQSQILRRASESRMVGFRGVGASPEQKLVARIEVVSKDGLRLEDVHLLHGLEFSVDHASYEVVFERARGQVTFAAGGVVRITGQLLPFILGLVEAQLH
jgi:hypothetical protein